jgi:hypothetical protein
MLFLRLLQVLLDGLGHGSSANKKGYPEEYPLLWHKRQS